MLRHLFFVVKHKFKVFLEICIQNLAPHTKMHYLCTQKSYTNSKQSYNETKTTQFVEATSVCTCGLTSLRNRKRVGGFRRRHFHKNFINC